MSQAVEHPFPIVGVGASAGGLGALTRLIGALPPLPDLALVIIQHLDPHADSHLASILQAHTAMSVVDAVHGMSVATNHVYVIQPNTSVAIVDGVLSVTPRPDDRRPHYPIDHFLRSLATVRGSFAVGVILSGTGSDGTLGLCEIKAAGGVTFAQDEQSAQYAGMAQSAVASGAVDLVLPPADIAARLTALPQHPLFTTALAPERSVDADQFQRVISTLRNRSGVDFSQYRDTTIKRRTARRMLLRGFTTPAEYAAFLDRDAEEATALYHDVLINVTSFFRDPDTFEALKQQVFPAIVKNHSESQPIRVWAPGCSTGQEAYSIAMALLEYLDAVKAKRELQIFATDLGDPAALDKARAGIYPESIESEVSPERLRRFFTKEDRTYRIQKSVRDLCVFARQNITVDPPFSRVDLVSCRNVLIYMSAILQQRLLPVFHFALNDHGFLLLGIAETIGTFTDLFEVIDRTHKIYRKKESSRRPALTFMADDWLARTTKGPTEKSTAPPVDFQREADRVTTARYAPPAVLVTPDFEIQQFRGRTAPYLEAPAGQPTTNILRLAKEGLFTELRSALMEAKTSRAPVVREHLHVPDAGRDGEFTLRIVPVGAASSSDFRLLVFFEAQDGLAWHGAGSRHSEPVSSAADRDVTWLRQELEASKQYLQSIIDQQEAAGQDLRAAHEEVLSSNEELQSTNEELQTTKEELQAANEELTTVNEQFQNRNRELDALADDLSNFITSADVAMVTVGRDLCVRRLTPAAEKPFNLLQTDVGRSIEHLKFSLDIDHIGAVIEQVIASVQPWEREVVDRTGRWWMLRVRPYRTADNRIDGATLVAVDIDLIKQTHEMMEARDYALAIVQTVREPLVVLDAACRVGLANDAFYRLFGESPEQLEGRMLWETGGGVWSDPSLRRLLLAACEGRERVVNFEIQRTIPPHGARTLVLNAQSIVRTGHPTLLLLAIEDVTDARLAEALRVDAETLRLVDRRKDEFLGILAHELRNPLAPMRFALELMRRAEGSDGATARPRQVLERQVSHMVRIVDDLLDVSRITQGKVELRKEVVTLSTIVGGAVELARPTIDAAGHTLTLSLPEEPVLLTGDPIRLAQVFVNLLNNAVKFTAPGGHIWVIAEKTGETPHRPDQLRVRIRDTGIGIAPEMLPRIFEMFIQGDRSLERARGGLGVGLTLVRNLVALHGGRVEARSEGIGHGAEFIVTLPLDVEAQPTVAEPATPVRAGAAKSLRILVADDNDDGRDMLSFLLTSEGHQVATAVDGPSALAAAAAFRPQVAILDIGMPSLSGYAVAERLRERADAEPLLLIALTGLGQEQDKARAAKAGFDHHFTKPVDVHALTALLDRIS